MPPPACSAPLAAVRIYLQKGYLSGNLRESVLLSPDFRPAHLALTLRLQEWQEWRYEEPKGYRLAFPGKSNDTRAGWSPWPRAYWPSNSWGLALGNISSLRTFKLELETSKGWERGAQRPRRARQGMGLSEQRQGEARRVREHGLRSERDPRQLLGGWRQSVDAGALRRDDDVEEGEGLRHQLISLRQLVLRFYEELTGTRSDT